MMAWTTLPTGHEVPKYVGECLFSIRMHHGGRVVGGYYMDGKVTYSHNVDKDRMSMVEIHAMAEDLGYKREMIDYWYRSGDEDGSLMKLECDADVIDMCALVPYVRVIDLILDYKLECDDNDEVVLQNVASNSNNGAIPRHQTSTYGKDVGSTIDKDVEIAKKFESQSKKGGEAAKVKGKEKVVDVELSNSDEDYQEQFVDNQYGVDDDELLEELVGGMAEKNQAIYQPDQEETVNDKYDASKSWESWFNLNGAGEPDFIDNEDMFARIDSDNEELGDPKECSDEENAGTSINKFPKFNPVAHADQAQFVAGMQFANVKELRAAVADAGIKGGWHVVWIKREKYRHRGLCKADGCPFDIYASKMQHEDTIQIKTIVPEHTCFRVWDNSMVNSTWLAEKVVDTVKNNPTIPVDSLKANIQSDLRCGISKMKAYRAKWKAERLIDGTIRDQYARLWDYADELKRTNPGSTVKIECELNPGDDNHPIFQRMYICLESCKKGFKEHCRPLIGLDGCFLTGPYGGQLLTAVGLDANNMTWVISYAMVELECKDSWKWFLHELVNDLKMGNGGGWTFISDKQKGLIPAFAEVIPNADHRFCAWHLYTNFYVKFKGKALKDELWAAARATTIPYFNKAMENMKRLSPNAYKWLTDAERPPQHWSRAFFPTHLKCDILLNNLSESFNSWILVERNKPIISMMEDIRVKIMKRIQLRRDMMMKFNGRLCPQPRLKLEKAIARVGDCIPKWSGGSQYEVDTATQTLIVDLERRTCSCRKWDLTGIPCKHAVAAIYMKRDRPEEYVDNCYLKEAFLKTYDNIINPMTSMDFWGRRELNTILPPQFYRQAGRPRKVRRKGAHEVGQGMSNGNDNVGTRLERNQRSLKCSICEQVGHNKKSCHRHKPIRPQAGKSRQQDGTSTPQAGTKRKKEWNKKQAYF